MPYTPSRSVNAIAPSPSRCASSTSSSAWLAPSRNEKFDLHQSGAYTDQMFSNKGADVNPLPDRIAHCISPTESEISHSATKLTHKKPTRNLACVMFSKCLSYLPRPRCTSITAEIAVSTASSA